MDKIKTIKEERKTYLGIDYVLKMLGTKNYKNIDDEKINDNVWWVLEYEKKDEQFARSTFRNFLWYDTRGMAGSRLKDKYNQCELTAIDMINRLLAGHFFSRMKFILMFLFREIKFFIICERRIFWKRIKYFKELFKIRKQWKAGQKNGKPIGKN